MSQDFTKICRLCLLEPNDELLPIFQQQDDLSDKLMTVVPALKISVGDGMPEHVCSRCVLLVTISYNFKVQCETSDSTLNVLYRFSNQDHELNFEEHKENSIIDTIGRTVVKEEVFDQEITIEDNTTDTYTLDVSKEQSLSDYAKEIDNLSKPPENAIKINLEQYWKESVKSKKLLPKKYVCELCGKTFTRKSRLSEHKYTHTGEKPLSCDICGKHFSIKSSLDTHKKIHVDDKKFECAECGIRFVQHSNLITHSLTHTGSKPYPCMLCGKKFSRLNDLQRHGVIHTGEKPFECSFCGNSFSRKYTLKKHLEIHENVQ